MRDGKRKPCQRLLSLLMVLCMTFVLALGCTACGGVGGGSGASAASMFLRKTEGTVAVSDAEGAEVAPEENLGLYSGYTVGTGEESYAWIDLDKVKLTKLDANSAVEIVKDGKNLSINVTSGSLFFNITEPLAGDETMEISTSSLLVGIRGTCGWVEVPAAGTMRVYILEGKVECTAKGNTATVNAGEMAEMKEDGEVTVKEFSRMAVPDFVVGEFLEDSSLKQAVQEASGINISGHPMSDYAQILRQYESRGQEVLFAEEIDFELDGSPELFVIYDYSGDMTRLDFDVYRLTQGENDPGYTLLFSNNVVATLNYELNDTIHTEIARISLVESEGRPYVLAYHNHTYSEAIGTHVQEEYRYMGSVAQNDGEHSSWGWTDAIDFDYYEGSNGDVISNYFSWEKENGLYTARTVRSTAAEYEAVIAQYTEVRALAVAGGE